MTVDAYLDALRRRLGGPRRWRHRVLLEVADHLACSVTDRVGAGTPRALAETEATEAFGPPLHVAMRFRHVLAERGSGRAATLAIAAAAAALGIHAVVFTELTGDRGPAPWVDAPVAPLMAVAGQVAVVAATITLLRRLLMRAPTTTATARMWFVDRAAAVTALAAGVDCAATLGAAMAAPAAAFRTPATSFVCAVAAAGSVVAAAAWTTARVARLRVGVVGFSSTHGLPQPDVVDDVQALGGRALAALGRHRPGTAERLRAAAHHAEALLARHPRAAAGADVRGHPWRACTAFAAAIALFQTAALWAARGTGAIADGAFEGAAVLVAFALAGGALGLRPPLRRRGR